MLTIYTPVRVLYISTSFWVLNAPESLSKKILWFLCKKAEKGRKSNKIDAKFRIFFYKFAPERWLRDKTLDQLSLANFQKGFFAKLCIKFLAFSSFFQLFCPKTLKKRISNILKKAKLEHFRLQLDTCKSIKQAP